MNVDDAMDDYTEATLLARLDAQLWDTPPLGSTERVVFRTRRALRAAAHPSVGAGAAFVLMVYLALSAVGA